MGFQLWVVMFSLTATFPSFRTYSVTLFADPGDSIPQLTAVVVLVQALSQYTLRLTAFIVP